MYRRIAAAVMLASASLVVGTGWAALRHLPERPRDRTVSYCAPRPMLAESFHACRNENVLVNL